MYIMGVDHTLVIDILSPMYSPPPQHKKAQESPRYHVHYYFSEFYTVVNQIIIRLIPPFRVYLLSQASLQKLKSTGPISNVYALVISTFNFNVNKNKYRLVNYPSMVPIIRRF